MNRRSPRLVVVALSVAAVTGCATQDQASDDVTTRAEAAFLDHVQEALILVGTDPRIARQNYIDLGKSVCFNLGNDASETDVVDTIVESGAFGRDAAVAIVTTAEDDLY